MNRPAANLSRRLLRGVLLVAGGASLLLGLLFLGLYRQQLERERAEASMQLNRMLQVTWENAMLKRDVDGLRDIVGKLGELAGIRDVLILAPGGEVRFASDQAKLGRQMAEVAVATTVGRPISRFQETGDRGEVLRSINPVPNRTPCMPCHGPPAVHPVNGVLVVDYDAAPIRDSARRSAALLLLAGTAVIGLTLTTLWFLLRRYVISPLAGLDAATRALAGGDLTARAPVATLDEIGRASASFNSMAERLAHQLALAEAQQRYLQQLIDALPDGLRVIRVADKQVVLVNRAFAQQLGRTQSEILALPCHLASHGRAEPCVATLVVCPLSELQYVGATLKASHHHQRADGTLFPAEVHAVLVEIDSEGRSERYVVESVRDLGQAARVSHEQRLSELGLLAAGIAHEIHNPLGSVRLGVQGLTREIREGSIAVEQIVDYMGLIDQEIDNCIAVTRRLLLLARPPSHSLQVVVLNEALSDTLRLLEFDAQTRGIEQQLELPTQPLRVLADEAEVRMIFLNLIQNAHHAMHQGGRLTARMSVSDGHALIEIGDSGIGMDAEHVARIFDPFFSRRADGVVGTGLGLTIVKNFVERMGGDIAVDSEVNEGTRFRIRLALAEKAIEEVA